MRVLVTGCAGFIGWTVSRLLLANGDAVVGVDSLNDTYDLRLKNWRLSQLEQEAAFEFHRIDITDSQAVVSVLLPDSFDSVIHLAARAGVRDSLKEPLDYFETNLTGTLTLLERCRQTGVPKFVFASTSSVYGEGERPFREDMPTDCPLSPYAASKKAAELACHSYHQVSDLDVTILRYFTVYGPAGRPDMSVLRFVKCIAEGQPLQIYGDGLQERDFTYVEDIARGTVAALQPTGFEVINLGSDHPTVLRDLVSAIEKVMGRQACIQTLPAQPGDVSATWADITKAKAILSWDPQVSLEEGIFQTANWYKGNRSLVKDIL